MLQQWELRTHNLNISWLRRLRFRRLVAKTQRGWTSLSNAIRERELPAGEPLHLSVRWTWRKLGQLGKRGRDVTWSTGEQIHALVEKTRRGLEPLGRAIQEMKWPAGEHPGLMTDVTWHALGRSLVGFYARLAFKLDVSWHGPLPDGPKIIAANHPTTVDPALVMLLVAEQSSILIHETLFKVPVLGRYLKRAGHVPVVTDNGRPALEEAKRLLEAGRTIVIFPEGALSPAEGGLQRPHTGAARLSLITGAPIVPVGIHLEQERVEAIEAEVDGKTEVGRLYLQGPYAMTVGEPMAFTGDVEDREYVRSASMRIMQHIMSLSQESAFRIQASRVSRTAPLTASLAFASFS